MIAGSYQNEVESTNEEKSVPPVEFSFRRGKLPQEINESRFPLKYGTLCFNFVKRSHERALQQGSIWSAPQEDLLRFVFSTSPDFFFAKSKFKHLISLFETIPSGLSKQLFQIMDILLLFPRSKKNSKWFYLVIAWVLTKVVPLIMLLKHSNYKKVRRA